MKRNILKLTKKIDELQKQINYQNECIMDQSMIIHKLIEKINPINPLNPYKPYNPPAEKPFTWPTEPTYNNNVTCLHCGRNTGIPLMLHMVIPPEGLKCPHCGRTAVYSNSPTCQEPFSVKAVPSTGDDPTMPWQTTTLRPYETFCKDHGLSNTSTTNFQT
jgi:hypothetical protein